MLALEMQRSNEEVISPPRRLTLVSGFPKFTGSEGRGGGRSEIRHHTLPMPRIWKTENSKRL